MHDIERLRRLVTLYFVGVGEAQREGLIYRLLVLMNEEVELAREEAREEVLDGLADIVGALQTIATES